MTFCDHTGPKSSQTCHTRSRAGRQWELMWAFLPDRTPLWRLFPLPGTTTRRLSPQKHPPDPPCRPSGCGGLPLASSQQHGQLDLWAGRAGTRQTWTGGAHRLDSTTTESALLRHSSRRLVQFSSAATDRGGPARCRPQPSTIPRLRRQTTLLCLRHRETP